jgi:hypothetical protein
VAARQVRLHRAKWVGKQRIRLRFDPFAYRYIRLKILERDKYICYWCGSPGFTIDHIIPWSRGGRTNLANCICACEKCNGARGDKPVEIFALERNVEAPASGSAFEAPLLPLPKPALQSSLTLLRVVPRPMPRAVVVEALAPMRGAEGPAVPHAVEGLLTPDGARGLAKLLDRDSFIPTRNHLR